MISSQPMPLEEIKEGDIVKCKIMYNKEVQITKIKNNYKQVILYEAQFLDMPYIKGIFHRDSLIKERKKIEIYCNDCDTKSIVEFHYGGHECKKCGSFNTG